jgi:hypothetical protein
MDTYRGKKLGDYTSEQLKAILVNMAGVLETRIHASKHDKFTRTDGKALEFPPLNPNFVKLKSAIENELAIRG